MPIIYGTQGNDVIDQNYSTPVSGANDTIKGGAGNDQIVGLGGDDFIQGGEGADTLTGGDGYDRVDYATSAQAVSVNASYGYLGSGSAGDSGGDEYLDEFEAVGGSRFADILEAGEHGTALYGQAGNDTLVGAKGAAGNDYLDGGAGADFMLGGLGNDTYVVDDPGDFVRDDRNGESGGIDTIIASISYTLTEDAQPNVIENLVLSGTADLTGTGNSINNAITGNSGANALSGLAGNDTLNGGYGADTLTGGAGNDIYYVDNAGDKVVEAAGQGADIVHTTLSTYTLGANVEWVYMDGTGANIARGNDLSNRVYGNSGDDRFVIDAGGNDTFFGGAGIDSFDARSSTTGIVLHLENQSLNAGAIAGDTFGSVERFSGSNTAADSMTANSGRAYFVGGGGNDTLIGGANNDQLIGGDGADSLVGGGARDVLWGGAGNDTMSGGTSADRDYFQFGEANFGRDRITDFQDGIDVLKFLSSVADNVSDFTITGNGTHDVVVRLNAQNTITLHNDTTNITIDARDFLFY